LPFNIFFLKNQSIKHKCNNLAGVRKQNCSSFANLWFERWLLRVCKCAAMWVGFPSSFLWVGRKKQNKFPSNLHCPVKKLNPFLF
jgi:hypothetical protein